MRRKILVGLLTLGLSASLCLDAEVTSWRNGGMGLYPDARAPLSDWSAAETLVWKAPLGTGNGSPVLVDGKLFFTEEPSTLVCVDSADGTILWRRENGLLNLLGLSEAEIDEAEETIRRSEELDKEIARMLYEMQRMNRRSNLPQAEKNERVGELMEMYLDFGEEKRVLSQESKYGSTVEPASHPDNGYASYTPVTDGETVFVAFGYGVVVAYDFSGNRIWHKVLDDTDHIFGGSTSPLLADGKLVVRFSDYVALDPATGEEQWRVSSNVVFGTSAIFEVEDESFLFTPRGEVIRIADGEKLTDELVEFNVDAMSWSTFNSPVVYEGDLLTVRGLWGQEGDAYRFEIPESKAVLEEKGLRLAWKASVRKDRYYASPVAHNGLLYSLSANNFLSVLEIESGKLVYEHRIDGVRGTTYPSVALAGDYIFIGSDNGSAILLEPGREYKEAGRSLVSAYRSTPIFEDDIVYLRTFDGIQAIGGG